MPKVASTDAARLYAKVRAKLGTCVYRWRISVPEMAVAVGIKPIRVSDFTNKKRGPRWVTAEPSIALKFDEALDVIVRERARNALARLDPEFAAWDAARRERDAAREKAARRQAIAEARALAGEADLVL